MLLKQYTYSILTFDCCPMLLKQYTYSILTFDCFPMLLKQYTYSILTFDCFPMLLLSYVVRTPIESSESCVFDALSIFHYTCMFTPVKASQGMGI